MCTCSATEFTSGAGTSDSAGRQRVSEPRVDGHRGACAATGEKLLAKPLDQGQSGVDSCSSPMISFLPFSAINLDVLIHIIYIYIILCISTYVQTYLCVCVLKSIFDSSAKQY